MGSLHLCNTAVANFQQTKSILPPHASSTTFHATRTILNCNPGKYSLVSNRTRKGCHIVMSMEQCISYSRTIQQFPLKIGIIGLGEFGQFLATAFKQQRLNVLGTSRSDYSEFCREHGIKFYQLVLIVISDPYRYRYFLSLQILIASLIFNFSVLCRALHDMCEAQPDVLLLCNSILSTEDVVHKIPFHKLKPDTIIIDVLSVKL